MFRVLRVLAVALAVGLCCVPAAMAQQDPRAQIEALIAEARDAAQKGDWKRGEAAARTLYEMAKEDVGERHEATLAWMNNLAYFLYQQGRYGEAEPLFLRALELRGEVLGERHPSTLTSLNNLAGLYKDQGRYGEAEPLLVRALELLREALGERHPYTLRGLNNLVVLYHTQGRYGEAEPLYARALELRREVLGERHPQTLTSLNNLAELYRAQGRYGEAEPLYVRALELLREELGERHPTTLISLSNLALLYHDQGRYGEAEPLYVRALELLREELGERHPNTLLSLNNLAGLYHDQGRYGEAEPLLVRALELYREELGERHPDTLTTGQNLAVLLSATGREAEAAALFRELDRGLFLWAGTQLQTTRQARVRSGVIAGKSAHQSMILSLALRSPGAETQALAADIILKWKLVIGEEDAVLERIAREGGDAQVVAAANALAAARNVFTANDSAENLQRLEDAELALRQLSAAYRSEVETREVQSGDIAKLLAADEALVEFRSYRRYDFKAGGFTGPWRMAASVIRAGGVAGIVDLGPVAELRPLAGAIRGDDPAAAEAAARALHRALLAPLAEYLFGAERLYIAPDALLHLVPFDRLIDESSDYLIKSKDLRLLQTGRDLAAPKRAPSTGGLLAVGGVDYGAKPETPPGEIQTAEVKRSGARSGLSVSRNAAISAGFAPLPGSEHEVTTISRIYGLARRSEPREIWRGAGASEARLGALAAAPRVVHLATHGFYKDGEEGERPLLLSALAMAGANRGEGDGDQDGVLHALEVMGLNLDGTELVVLSACDAALGAEDISEGIYGLGRALRVAGAENVLLTLWPLGDFAAADFMIDFYTNWLSAPDRDPSDALRETKLAWINSSNPQRADPKRWAPYVLYGR